MSGDRHWADALLRAVGEQRQDRVVKALSKVLHPDAEGGDHTLMATLLAARERHRGSGRGHLPTVPDVHGYGEQDAPSCWTGWRPQ